MSIHTNMKQNICILHVVQTFCLEVNHVSGIYMILCKTMISDYLKCINVSLILRVRKHFIVRE